MVSTRPIRVNPYVGLDRGWPVTFGFNFVGFYDDYLKVTAQSHAASPASLRLLLEVVTAMAACYALVRLGRDSLDVARPPVRKDVVINFGWFFVIFGPSSSSAPATP